MPTASARELGAVISEFRAHASREMQVFERTLANGCRYPLLSVVEGISAATCDIRQDANFVINHGRLRTYFEIYNDDDNLIKPPQDRDDYGRLPGSHAAFLIDPDIARAAGEAAYDATVDPRSLQIAQLAIAA